MQIDGGLCADCGTRVVSGLLLSPLKTDPIRRRRDSLPPNSASLSYDAALFSLLEGQGSRLIFTAEGAAEEAQRLTQTRLNHQRLCLVLDLDQTLIETTANERAQVALLHAARRRNWNSAAAAAAGQDSVHVLEVPPDFSSSATSVMRYYVKLRPGLRQFLERSKEIFDLYVYTNGCRNYATHLMELIDPTGQLFESRILTITEAKDSFKALSKLLPFTDHAHVLVVDDRAIDIWGTCKNLVKIPAFHYWRVHDHSVQLFPTSPFFPSRPLKRPPPCPDVERPFSTKTMNPCCDCACQACAPNSPSSISFSSSTLSSTSSSSTSSSSTSTSQQISNQDEEESAVESRALLQALRMPTVFDHLVSYLEPEDVVNLASTSRGFWHLFRKTWERVFKLFRYERSPVILHGIMPSAWQPFRDFVSFTLRSWSSHNQTTNQTTSTSTSTSTSNTNNNNNNNNNTNNNINNTNSHLIHSQSAPVISLNASQTLSTAPSGTSVSTTGAAGNCHCLVGCRTQSPLRDQCWFLYFLFIKRIFPRKSPYSYAYPVNQIIHSSSIQDRGLQAVYHLLQRVHKEFFELGRKRVAAGDAHIPDTRFILKHQRAQILKGTVLVFGGIFPQGIDTHKCMLVQLAQAFGAECASEVREGITHVVCLSNRTQKAQLSASLSSPPFVVSVFWLIDSVQFYQRRDEALFQAPDQGLAPDDFHHKYSHIIKELHKNCVEGWESDASTSPTHSASEIPPKRPRVEPRAEGDAQPNSFLETDHHSSDSDQDLETALLLSFERNSVEDNSSNSERGSDSDSSSSDDSYHHLGIIPSDDSSESDLE